jgi:tetratricopeptide (TPR) repeat protein
VGRAYDIRGKVNLAYPYYIKSIELDATGVNAYSNLAGCYSELKKYDSAELYFKKGIALNQRFGLIYSNYAVMLRRLKRHDEALQIFKDCFINDSTCYDCTFNCANEYFERKEYEKAEGLYKKTTVIDPKHDYAFYGLATVGCMRNDKKMALQYFEEIIKLGVNDLEFWSTDKDISLLKQSPEFKTLIKKNYKAEEIAKYPELFKK